MSAMKRGRKPKLVLAGVLLAACAFAGGAWAASDQTNPASSRQAFISDVARRLGTTPQKLSSAMEAAYSDELNAAVKAGRLTRAQANAIERAVRQHGLGPMPPLFLAPPPTAPGKAPLRLYPRQLRWHGSHLPAPPSGNRRLPAPALPPLPGAPPPPRG